MTVETFMTMLFAVSVVNGLLTEAIKKFLDELKKTYSSNIVAGVVALIVGGCSCYAHALVTGVEANALLIFTYVAFVVLSWVCAMIGYDKVIQALKQIAGK